MGVVTALLVVLTARPHGVSAQTKDHLWTIHGVVTAVTAKALVVQTQSGGVPAAIGNWTRVVRDINGSGADVRFGVHAWVHVRSGTTTVDQIDVCAPGAWVPARPPKRSKEGLVDSGVPLLDLTHWLPDRDGTFENHIDKHQNTPPPGWFFGVVMKANSDALTLTLSGGRVAPFAEATNVTISKYTWGNLGDLAQGEQVDARLNTHGDVELITIVGA
jgi:hypothetical protein